MRRSKRSHCLLLTLVLAFTIIFVPNTVSALENQNSGDPLDLLVGLSQVRGADVYNEYRLKDTLQASYGTVYKFEQVKDDFVVPSGEIELSVGGDGRVLSVFGGYEKVGDVEANISLSEAEEATLGNVRSTGKVICNGESSYKITTDYGGGCEFVVSADGKRDRDRAGRLLGQRSLARPLLR